MARIVECVPNFSEGRRPEVIEAIAEAVRRHAGVRLLDVQKDPDHNRMVLTFIGDPESVSQAVFDATRKATELIDMREQHGSHPRIGATDVIPFVPTAGMTMNDCVELAWNLGQRLAGELGIPVYYYEAAAKRPERKQLEHIRQGQYEALLTEIALPERQPDEGPARMHPTAGATVVGARPPLIAFNVNLNTPKVSIAKQIAKAVRASSGGYTTIKAMGLLLTERNQAQVSMNVTDFSRTPLYRVLETVRMEALRWGVTMAGTEIVGLLPMDALVQSVEYYRQRDAALSVPPGGGEGTEPLSLDTLVESAEHYMQIENFRKDQVLEYWLLPQ